VFLKHCGIPNALGIPQCVRNTTNLGPVFLEGQKMTQYESKHVALNNIFYVLIKKDCCV